MRKVTTRQILAAILNQALGSTERRRAFMLELWDCDSFTHMSDKRVGEIHALVDPLYVNGAWATSEAFQEMLILWRERNP